MSTFFASYFHIIKSIKRERKYQQPLGTHISPVDQPSLTKNCVVHIHYYKEKHHHTNILIVVRQILSLNSAPFVFSVFLIYNSKMNIEFIQNKLPCLNRNNCLLMTNISYCVVKLARKNISISLHPSLFINLSNEKTR